MKYQFILNGKVVSAKQLQAWSLGDMLKDYMDLENNVIILDDLLEGKEIELDCFISENAFDTLQLKKVGKQNER